MQCQVGEDVSMNSSRNELSIQELKNCHGTLEYKRFYAPGKTIANHYRSAKERSYHLFAFRLFALL